MPDACERLLLMTYLVRFRQGHENGPNEEEVASMSLDHLANVGLDPCCNRDACLRLLGEQWSWALDEQ